MCNWGLLLAAWIGAVLLAIFATTPPAPAPAGAPAAAFSADRAMADVAMIARAPHPTGSEANAATVAYLVERLRGLGLAVETVRAPLPPDGQKVLARWRGAVGAASGRVSGPAPELVNIVATLAGRDPAQPAVLLMAHHDSVWGSPGAADDGAGVAAILEAVRALRGDRARARDLIVLLTDGEELGLQGAKAFFAADPRARRVGVVVNLETRGGGGRASMFETGAANGAMMRLFGASVARPVTTSLSTFVYQRLPNRTDYTIARELGVPGYNFAFIGRPGLYHSQLATPDAVDRGAVQDMGRQVLDLTRGLLAAPVLPGAAPDPVFFDAFGLVLVSYPGWAGWLLLGLAVAGYAVAGWRRASPGQLGVGAGATLALILVAVGLTFAVNLVSGADGATNYYDRMAAVPRLQLQALFACLAAVALVGGGLFAARPARAARSMSAATVGAAIPLLVLAAIAQAVAPTAAFVLIVPLLLGGVALALMRVAGEPIGRIAPAIAAATAGGYLLGLSFFLLQAVGLRTPMVAAVPLALAAVLTMPLVPVLRRRGAWLFAALCLSVAVAVALTIRLDPVAPGVPTYSDFKR